MVESSRTGSRVRERRLSQGMRQTELARAVGISPSYLNLIEHNRRRIGGKTLLDLAAALEVEPALLSEGAEATLIAGLREVLEHRETPEDAVEGIEEFATRFPGWAELVVEVFRDQQGLETTVKALTDRLAHDPHLADSLHEVLSVVTAIRSTAAILADTRSLEAEWQQRFHRNINEDSQRLAEGAEALVKYLDAAPEAETSMKLPQDELEAFVEAHDYHFPAIETGGADAIEEVLQADGTLRSATALKLAQDLLQLYAEDARRVPLEPLVGAVGDTGVSPQDLAARFGVDPARMLRRLAALPAHVTGPTGLVGCDGSGAITLHKPLEGFEVPRMTGACPLWPLFRVLGQPGAPMRARLRHAGRDDPAVVAMAASQTVQPVRFNEPPLLRAYMLVIPHDGADHADPAEEVGKSCRVCPRQACHARREPSVVKDGF
ncbi:helix-turn-helix domain-containing protein [Roseovarius salinarum]|uniref:helix-turn-helix domain-containing protein n=1 Tax=Roseovarius salinarum TaxID=1981892 RepID=UPI000C31E344|nr:helix-turn-helix transcriptional regulator [Roseovarius salinarum]